MNTHFVKQIALLFFCLVVVSFGQAQNSYIESAFQDALNANNIVDRGNGIFEFRSRECNFRIKDFDNFTKSHSQYIVTEVEYEYHYRFGYHRSENVTRFSFRLNDDSSCSMEQAVRVVNNNMSLKMPAYHDIKASDRFYRQYVKRYPTLAESYKREFNNAFMNYYANNASRMVSFFKGCPYNSELLAGFDAKSLLDKIATSPEGIITFCEGSPYDQEFLKSVDIQSFLVSNRSDRNYVYLQKPNEGFIVNKNSSYSGGIVNKQKHGKGKLVHIGANKAQGTYEGNFSKDKMEGAMLHTWNSGKFTATNGKNHYREYYRYKENGTMKNDKWNGNVELVIGFDRFFPNQDIFNQVYNNGILVSSTARSDALSRKEMELDRELERIASQQVYQPRTSTDRTKESQEQQAKNRQYKKEYHRDYDVTFPSGHVTEWIIQFGDGSRGSIAYMDWNRKWYCHKKIDPFLNPNASGSEWRECDNETQAINKLYELLHQ